MPPSAIPFLLLHGKPTTTQRMYVGWREVPVCVRYKAVGSIRNSLRAGQMPAYQE
jgi:hypothetical protein